MKKYKNEGNTKLIGRGQSSKLKKKEEVKYGRNRKSLRYRVLRRRHIQTQVRIRMMTTATSRRH